MKRFEPLEHPSDVGITAYGKSMEEAFENAALGMFSLTVDLEKVKPTEAFEIEARGEDKESLLVNFLNELLFLFDTNHVILRELKIKNLTQKSIKVKAFGEKIDLKRHELRRSIKAATYNQLIVAEDKGKWKARVVFDV